MTVLDLSFMLQAPQSGLKLASQEPNLPSNDAFKRKVKQYGIAVGFGLVGAIPLAGILTCMFIPFIDNKLISLTSSVLLITSVAVTLGTIGGISCLIVQRKSAVNDLLSKEESYIATKASWQELYKMVKTTQKLFKGRAKELLKAQGAEITEDNLIKAQETVVKDNLSKHELRNFMHAYVRLTAFVTQELEKCTQDVLDRTSSQNIKDLHNIMKLIKLNFSSKEMSPLEMNYLRVQTAWVNLNDART